MYTDYNSVNVISKLQQKADLEIYMENVGLHTRQLCSSRTEIL
jgi:hypothetical protein